jgi:hypothetical protein
MSPKDEAVVQVRNEEDYDYDIFPQRAEKIVEELRRTARRLSQCGYGTTSLIFSDLSFVSLSNSISEVADLLRAGHHPLGCIAPDRERKRNPFIEAWGTDDEATLAELRSLAHSIYWHLLPERVTQQLS